MIAVFGLAVLFIAVQNGFASEISVNRCLKASAEKKALVAQGYENYLERGPLWASTNLSPAKIDGVKRLISVIELLEFRCNTPQMRARRAHMNSPAFHKWKALKPPLPQRNPRLVGIR